MSGCTNELSNGLITTGTRFSSARGLLEFCDATMPRDGLNHRCFDLTVWREIVRDIGVMGEHDGPIAKCENA
jgi:hypothetical protein